MLNLEEIEIELKKRWQFPYVWGRKQIDDWDRKTNFIYNETAFEVVLKKSTLLGEELRNYALNRWYNFLSAMAVEQIFVTHPIVTPCKDKFDKQKDFFINKIPFDHKSTVFPRRFDVPFDKMKGKEKDLIEWLYENQSQQGRKHFANRLFIVFYDSKEQKHWKIKAELKLIQENVNEYLNNFDAQNLIQLNIESRLILSDLIWVSI